MHRHPAHWDRRPAILAALGQRDVEAGRGDLGVVEEQFEEIAHPIEQQGVGRFVLETAVLDHHRSRGVCASHRAIRSRCA